jgi:MFS family permease
VKEGGYPPVDDSAHGAQLRGVYAASVYARECFSAPYYRWVIAAMVVSGLVFMPVNLFSLPFAQSLHITTKMYGQYLALTYLISLCLSYLLGYLTDRFHPLTTGIVAMAAYAVTSLGGGLLATGQTSFAIFLVAHGVISGTFFTCTASLGQKLFPRMKYAQFASAAGVVAALLNIVVAPVVGELLDKTGHAYRITCDIGFLLALASLGLMLGVLRRFNGLGGTAAYVPPAA